MNILILTRDGTGLGLAQRLAQEGHAVDVFTDEIHLVHTGRRLYKITNNLWKAVKECKFVITDCGNWPGLYDKAKTYNKPIIGSHELTDVMNNDAVREYDLGSRLGVAFPPTQMFNDSSDLFPKVMSEGRYFIKYARRVIPCTRKEWLAWAIYNMPIDKQVLLQDQVLGRDVCVMGWFNGLNWVQPFYIVTPYSEKMKAVAMLAIKPKTPLKSSEKRNLVETTLKPMDKWLKLIDYKGPVTASLIVNEKNVYVRKFYMGMTGPALYAVMEGLRDISVTEFFNAIATGNESEINVSMDYLLGIEVQNRDEDMEGAPIVGIEDGTMSHIFLHGVYKEEDDYLMSGETLPIYTATARGRDFSEAANRLYRTIEQVQFPRMYYLSNLPGQLRPTFNKLRSWSFI